MSLFAELKRRNVFRTTAAYLVLSWVLMQIGDLLFDALQLDDKALTVLLALLALGFIPVVVFSWIYELTPEGVKREAEVDRSQSITGHTGKRLDIAIVILLAIAVAFFGWGQLRKPAATDTSADAPIADTAASEPSIAVLPFTDLSPEGDQRYFADGISEELLNVLAQIDGLKVSARTSSFQFRGDNHDITAVGEALGVDTILEGSVRKAGDQLRITAQLIEVDGGFHLWSANYDRTLDNVFVVQEEIASSIVDALKLELQLPSEGLVDRSIDSTAYDLYLRGRNLSRDPNKEDLLRALEYYDQAVAIDPDFAAAHGAIASAWIWLEDYGGIPSLEAFNRAEPAARRALELDPTQAAALTAMGFFESRKYDNEPAARDYFERALAANPAFVEAYTLYGDALQDLGETPRALQVRRDAVERDPLSSFLKSRLASQLVALGEYEEAEQLIAEILDEDPENAYGVEELGNLHFRRGQLAEAVPLYQSLHEFRPGDPFAAANTAATYAIMLDFEKANEWIAVARGRGADNRWELNARKSVAQWQGDWDEVFRVGELRLNRVGFQWQGEAYLARGDWDAARISFQRGLAQQRYRTGDPVNGNVLHPLIALAFAEKQLGIQSWAESLPGVRAYTEARQLEGYNIGTWPGVNVNYLLAALAAVESSAEAAATHMTAALEQGYLQHDFLEFDPLFEEFRDDERLIEIAAKMRERALEERRKLRSRDNRFPT